MRREVVERGTILRALVLGALLLASPGAKAVASDAGALDYVVVRDHGPATDRFVVTLRFRGDASGTTMLQLPGEWASARHAERGIDDLVVLTKGARLEATDKPDIERIVHLPHATLTVRYALRQIADGDPKADAPTPYLPVIRPGYFEWIGWTTWVFPTNATGRLHVTVRFANLPPDWNFASSFGLDPKRVTFDGDLGAFRSSIFVSGDFRLRSRVVRGGTLITALRGDWAMRDSQLADRVATIVDGERQFWRDDAQPFYLVSVVPISAPPGWRSITGTGLSRSFAAFVSDGTALQDLDAIWTHEYFHNWNNLALGRFDEPEATMYWFSEGFTDYYTDLLQLRWGMKTLDEYAQAYDDKLRALAESPVARLPNAEIPARFFTSRAIGKLPYLRGQFLAASWDAQIRTASAGRRSLDDAMRALRDEHRHGAVMLDRRRIVDRVTAEGVTDASGDIDREIERGDLPPFVDGTLTSCIAVRDVTAARFDWGFDYETTITGKPISGVRVDGPAYAAGVRDGQWLSTAKEGRTRTSPVEVGVQSLPDETVRVLRYAAVGAPLLRRSATLKADLTAEQRATCTAALGVPASTQVPSTLAQPARP